MDHSSNVNLGAKQSVTLTNWLPKDDHRRLFYEVNPGLNIRGSCKNPNCITFKYQMQDYVWLKKGYGIFDMAFIKNKNFCPGCQTIMDSVSFKEIGYLNARVTSEGNKLTNWGGHFIKTTEQDFSGKLIKFGSKQPSVSEFSEWLCLYLTVQKGDTIQHS